MSRFTWFVGLRYTRSGRRARDGTGNGFISFIAALSVAGIALGVAALIVVMSVMNGFQKDVRDRMLSVLAHIEVHGPVSDWQALAREAESDERIIGAAPFAAGQVVIARGDVVRGAGVRGIDPQWEPKVSGLANEMREGALTDLIPGRFGIVVGKALADDFNLRLGDRLALIAPEPTVSPAGIVPRMRQFTVVGIFESGHYEYDAGLILMSIEDAGKLFRQSASTGVRFKTSNMFQAPLIARDLSMRLGNDYSVRDWSTENRVWFAAVQVEKRMMFIILTLIIAVAAFNLVSMLVMTVTEKRPDIAILRTLGATPRAILAIFMIQGSVIGLMGTAVGIGLGVAVGLNISTVVAWIEQLFGFRVLPPGIYVISELPSDLRMPDVAWVGAISCVLALAATIYPSLRAARVRPAEALRHE